MTSSVALGLALSLMSSVAFAQSDPGANDGRRWLAGDHHVHSRFSARYTPDPAAPEAPPVPQLGGDGNHTIIQNAEAAQRFGLSWMVSTDHGGPLHARLNAEQAWPELLQARERVPGLVLFYGMEFDTPGAEHSSLIIPQSAHEREDLLHIEGRYGRRQPWPVDPARDTEAFMLEALRDMGTMSPRPVVVINHPSRSATGLGEYGEVRPAQLRDWSEVTPRVVIGMEGAPGHQADGLFADGRPDPAGSRGIYRRFPTLGGFDQMTARLGGVWDSLLGEGRRWWITATSDSHTHISEGGDDFWPGEYAKTWVMARPDSEDILDGLREGRVFVTTGDLISELDLSVSAGGRTATIGGELEVGEAEDILVTLRVRDPRAANAGGRTPAVDHIDLIVGDVSAPGNDRDADANPTTRVERRFTAADWTVEGEVLTMTHRLPVAAGPRYLRVRGSSTAETEPQVDTPGEDPWSDLWFYGNPVFLTGSAGAR
ncbi:phosphoesterase [Brevundimonas sp.]|uniref:phosphoesterase n=1 Tax=Brevundimonas sp. TaxID=1871086 RepID=UPI00286BA8AB|nr:phosphoesterase [Brevundimonas sp.]